MGKSSSSSIKKKRSKHSSKGSARTRSKTKRSKSKKLRFRDDLVSYSDFNSRRSESLSLSTSEDSDRKRSSRSRTRKDVKGIRRRARTRSTSTESEDSTRLRRKKGSKRKDDSESRKKTYEKKMKKKKARRDESICSRSSQSWSCSAHQSLGSGRTNESEHEMLRGRSERRENNKRKLENTKSANKWRRYRSGSCSHSKDNGNGNYSSEKKEICVNASQRLRSVITLRKEDKEERELHKDEHEGEMMYDYDDYPSCRSYDSNDVGNKSELAHQLHVRSEKKRSIENEKSVVTPISNIKTAKTIESNEVGENQCARSKPGYHRVGIDDCFTEKQTKNSGAVDSVNSDDLESVLRKRALENLRKFRGGPWKFHTNPMCPQDKNDSSVKSLSTATVGLGQNKSSNDGSTRVVPGDSMYSLQNYKKISDRKNGGNEFNSDKINVHPHEKVATGGKEQVIVTVGSGINKPRLVASALRQALSNATTTLKEAPASLELNQSKSSSQTVCTLTRPAPNGNGSGDKVNNASGSNSAEPSSCLTSAAGDISSNKAQDEGKEEYSQFEHKTMSVMRGGELVQVSYKVYIPKKAPALARRQLKQ